MKISIHSNVGKQRKSNQDYADYFTNSFGQTFFVLCDGVGGQQAGDIASQATTKYLGSRFESLDQAIEIDQASEWIGQMIEAVNQYILDLSKQAEQYEGMGTTLVLALIIDHTLFLAHVGDSRAYIFKDGDLIQMTEDHSLVNELIKSGEITEAEGQTHPRRNVVTQSIGGTEEISYEITNLSLEQVDIVMLCSDGLTNMLTKEVLVDFFNNQDHQSNLSHRLIDAANEAGGSDNITVIIVSDLDQGGEWND
ncbi:Stp1/IreP family PP2C-type Ser/Thr phosphatase [Hutsoniella sourekii]|uniref:Stp1/IreP family PP2C-type Ser/Thr phosphatase n=1 Tax=Hutsoniella sourekii TaxID=87650 RepID=UPI00048281A9|nr:Stp1/IreP family PP2C-type Ser/Thr phosphatase [Hutsoniella sourekii]